MGKRRLNVLDQVFKGCPTLSVNGEALAGYVKRKEQDEKGREALAVRAESLKALSRIKAARRCKVEYQTDTKRVSKRVRHWTDREIRKEYGIMAKPFETTAENVLHVIFEKGPISGPEIAGELGVKANNISGILSRLSKHMPEVLDRDESHHAYRYSAKKEMSVEAAYRLFKSRFNEKAPGKVEGMEAAGAAESGAAAEEANGIRAKAGITLGENTTINIMVSGRIEFVFKLG